MSGSHVVGQNSKRATKRLYSGTAAANGDTHSSYIISKYGEGIVFLEITAASGSSQTLDIIVQIQNPMTGTWHKTGDFSQKTSIGNDVGYVGYGVGEKMAISYTLGGNSPSFTFTVDIVFKGN